jgi:uncharacterized OB-fold protein
MKTSPSPDERSGTPAKPLPVIRPETAGFWAAARRHELVIQQCTRCGQRMFFPRFLCHQCGSEELEWRPASGRGVIYSFTIVRQAAHPAFAAEVPYVYALIELEEGVRMIANVIHTDPATVHIGQPVQVVFVDATPEISLPQFEPIAQPA